MNNAGKEFKEILLAAQDIIDKKLSFLNTDTDLLQYVDLLKTEMKSEKGEILFRDNRNELQYCPCVTRFISFIDPSVKFPKDKKRNPFECAKIQFLLCKKANSPMNVDSIQNKAVSFSCDCQDCYRLAMEGVFKGGQLYL